MAQTDRQIIKQLIRQLAACRFDAKVRFTRDGEVHFYGRMPGSIETGWWLFAQSIPEAVRYFQVA